MQTPPILVYSICYAMVFILSLISKKEGSQRLIKDDGSISDKPRNIISLHIMGIIWLGIVPGFVLQQPLLKTLTGYSFPDNSLLIIFWMLLIFVATLTIKMGNKDQQRSIDPDHTNYQLPVLFITRYFIIRSFFLFAYELFLRGFLLFDSIDAMGITMAVSLNVVLHVLLHLFSSKKEMLACIPFSLLVCWLSISFNAAWPAVVLHITFSLLFEINIYKSNFSATKIVQT